MPKTPSAFGYSGISQPASSKLCSLTAVASGSLTIGLSSIALDFRASSLTSGIINTITASPSNIIVPSGAKLGTLAGLSARIIVGVMNNAGTAELFVINANGGLAVDLSESGFISTTILNTSSNSSTVAYSTTARTNLPYRLVGFIVVMQATAGTWITAPTTVQGYGGQVVEQTKYTDSAKLGSKWIGRVAGTGESWQGIAWNGTLFAAVNYGSGTVLTSPDGITWTSRTAANSNAYMAIAWNGTLFAAVAQNGTGNRVMTSPDGITWTARTSSVDNNWQSIAWGNGLFVAVASTGTGDRVMTSPDGITWTTQVSAADNAWQAIAWNGTVFAAVANSGSPRGMYSSDGITWTSTSTGVNNSWESIAWGNGLFVAVASTGGYVITSPDGITWTGYSNTGARDWYAIAWNGTVFAAVAGSPNAIGSMVMTSPNGSSWADIPGNGYNIGARAIAWNGTVFAAIGSTITSSVQVITSA